MSHVHRGMVRSSLVFVLLLASTFAFADETTAEERMRVSRATSREYDAYGRCVTRAVLHSRLDPSASASEVAEAALAACEPQESAYREAIMTSLADPFASDLFDEARQSMLDWAEKITRLPRPAP